MKKLLSALLLVSLLFALTACTGASTAEQSPAASEKTADAAPAVESLRTIELNGESISANAGVKIEGTTAVITASGSYTVSGRLNNGCIVINTGDDAGKVELILAGADITNLTGSAILVEKAKQVDIVLEKGSENILTSGAEGASLSSDASGAVISAKDDIDIEGEGSLKVFGYINNGIACKNDIDIKGGNITVLALNNGIRGSDSVEVKGGSLTVTAGNDGIKSSTADKSDKGFIEISGGTVKVEAVGDGISAETELRITGGTVEVVTTGDRELISCKALKANTALLISGGTVSLESTDNALSCDADVAVSGGRLSIITAESGIRTKGGSELVEISGGELYISSAKKCFETDGIVSYSGGTVLCFGKYKTAPDFICEGLTVTAGNGFAGDELEGFSAAYNYNVIIKNA